MNEVNHQAQQAGHSHLNPFLALLASTLVLPGLGQLLTGRKIRGALMTVATTLWLPVAVIKLIRDLNAVMPELVRRSAAGEQIGFSSLQEALQPMAGELLWIFMPLLAVWFWTLADSIIYIVECKTVNRGKAPSNPL